MPYRFVKPEDEPSHSNFSITWKSDWIYQEATCAGSTICCGGSASTRARPPPFPRRNRGKALAYRAIRKARQIGA